MYHSVVKVKKNIVGVSLPKLSFKVKFTILIVCSIVNIGMCQSAEVLKALSF